MTSVKVETIRILMRFISLGIFFSFLTGNTWADTTDKCFITKADVDRYEQISIQEIEAGGDGDTSTQAMLDELGECPADIFVDMLRLADSKHDDESDNSDNNYEQMRELMQVTLVLELSKFGYGLFDDDGVISRRIVEDFQQTRGEPVTGELTLKQMFAAMELSDHPEPPAISIGIGGSILEDKPYISFTETKYRKRAYIEGSWWLDGPD